MQRKHLPLIFLPLLALGAGCTPLYTTDQVNATVSAKIKEVAAYQKINVTVETVILKKYRRIVRCQVGQGADQPRADRN